MHEFCIFYQINFVLGFETTQIKKGEQQVECYLKELNEREIDLVSGGQSGGDTISEGCFTTTVVVIRNGEEVLMEQKWCYVEGQARPVKVGDPQ